LRRIITSLSGLTREQHLANRAATPTETVAFEVQIALVERLETLLRKDDAAAGRLALELKTNLIEPQLQDELLLLCDLVDDVEYQQALVVLAKIHDILSKT